jgi:hypothetical protein
MMNDPNPFPTGEPPIGWRCTWAIDPDFAGEHRPKPAQRDFPSRDAAEEFKARLKTDSPGAVVSVTPVYLRRRRAPQEGL